jgi:signal transduction histidine kinase
VVRRVWFAVLIAYPLIWLALLSHQFVFESTALTQTMPARLEQDLHSLQRYTTAQEAAAFMQSAMLRYQTFRDTQPGYIELWSSDNRRIFFNPARPYPYPPLTAPLSSQPLHSVGTVIDGTPYRIYRRDSLRWSLRLALPELTLIDLIKRDGLDPGLIVPMLIALPLLLLPLGLAVKRGLLPLRVLSGQLAGRKAQDLAPLDFDVKYGELKPTVAALDALLQQLSGKIVREQGFVQDAAHALRTPMALIAAQAHVLARARTPEARLDAEQDINHAIARASHVIRQLLELARVDGMLAPNRQNWDVAQLARHDLAQMALTAMACQIELELEAPETLLHVLERNTFQSILHNLVDNAIRYGKPGGTVLVDLQKQGEDLLLSVSDDGPGIALEEREAVFERFYRGSGQDGSAHGSAHDTHGAGLGLAIVRQAAARLGGSVALLSAANGRGCRFVVQIPAANAVLLSNDQAFAQVQGLRLQDWPK